MVFIPQFLNVMYHMIDLDISKNLCTSRVLSCGSNGKLSSCNAGDPSLIPGLGRYSGKRNGYPSQFSFLENSIDRGA